jgi:hypothetical protein
MEKKQNKGMWITDTPQTPIETLHGTTTLKKIMERVLAPYREERKQMDWEKEVRKRIEDAQKDTNETEYSTTEKE